MNYDYDGVPSFSPYSLSYLFIWSRPFGLFSAIKPSKVINHFLPICSSDQSILSQLTPKI